MGDPNAAIVLDVTEELVLLVTEGRGVTAEPPVERGTPVERDMLVEVKMPVPENEDEEVRLELVVLEEALGAKDGLELEVEIGLSESATPALALATSIWGNASAVKGRVR